MFGRRGAAESQAPARPAIAGYRDFNLIGSGGFSKVYTAYQEQFARTVAVKVVTVDLSDSALRRLSRELAAAGQLDGHPHIIRIYESGMTESGQPYMTMELHEQGSYGDRVRRHGPLPLGEALDVGVKLASGLGAAHRRGIIHRDIKPQNVLVSPFVGPVLSDFGIAVLDNTRMTTTTEAFTALHVAPEVLEGHPASPSSDLYSLVSTLYELLMGSPPYAGTDEDVPGLLELMRRVRTSPTPRVSRDDVPAVAADQIAALMDRSPERRPPTARVLAERLCALQTQIGQQPTPLPDDVISGGPDLQAGDAAAGPDPWSTTPRQAATPVSPPGPPSPGTPAGPAAPPPLPPPPAPAPPEDAAQTIHVDRRPPKRPDLLTDGPHRRSKLPWVVGIAVVTVLLLSAGGWWLLREDTDDRSDQTSPTSEPDPDAAQLPRCPEPNHDVLPDQAVQGGQPPTELSLEQSDDGTAATLRWDDPNNGRAIYLVFQQCQDEGGELTTRAVETTLPGEPTRTTVEDLSVDLNYCFTVGVFDPAAPESAATPYTGPDGTNFICMDQTTR